VPACVRVFVCVCAHACVVHPRARRCVHAWVSAVPGSLIGHVLGFLIAPPHAQQHLPLFDDGSTCNLSVLVSPDDTDTGGLTGPLKEFLNLTRGPAGGRGRPPPLAN
jgi:hypothetical protein